MHDALIGVTSGTCDISDVQLVHTNFNASYGGVQPATAFPGPGSPVLLNYNSLTGDVTMVLSGSVDDMIIQSASHDLIPGNWLGPNDSLDFFTGRTDKIGFDRLVRGRR